MEHNDHFTKFAETFCQMIDKLCSHTYEHQNQTDFYEKLKSNVPEDFCLAAGDFGMYRFKNNFTIIFSLFQPFCSGKF